MSAEDIFTHILSWASEDSHRGRLARQFRDNTGDSPELQARRMGLLSVYMQREAKSRKALAHVA
jgi:hypothetical protein